MVYKIFCAKFASEKEIQQHRFSAHALEERIYTDYREIEAESPIEAVHKYIKMYADDMEELSRLFGDAYYFFQLDNSGKIYSLSV